MNRMGAIVLAALICAVQASAAGMGTVDLDALLAEAEEVQFGKAEAANQPARVVRSVKASC